MFELGTTEKPNFNPKIDPDKRVAKEDYFKNLKDLQQINGKSTKTNEKNIARTRFDNQASVGGIGGDNVDEVDAISY